MNHFNQLLDAFQTEWAAARHQALPTGCTLAHDGTRYWWIVDRTGQDIINWECRPFPGCASLVVTTQVVLRDDLRGRGLGRFFREFRHKAYKRAGFVGEIATVRTDNPAQNRLMQTMGATKMGEFPSDFGGSYALWLTKLAEATNVRGMTRPEPPRPTRGVETPRPETGPTWNVPVPERLDSRQLYAEYNIPRVEAPTPVIMPGRRARTHAHRSGL